MRSFRDSLLTSLLLFSAISHADSPISLMQAGFTSAYLSASEPLPPEKCHVSARMVQAGLRHIEGKGIGYKQGYTTLELLIRPESGGYSIFPFFDLRGHIFDDGKFASNVGVGFRARTSSRIWGLNAYYDYRRTHKYRYNQVGIGYETLGRTWDFRLNGYLPVGTHVSRWYELKFDKFKGHSLFLKRKQEFAMKGVDGEIGAHLRSGRNPDLYVAAGPYYFENKDKHALGAKGRIGAKWRDYFSLELSGSYDNLFHGIVQGEVGFYIPLGPKSVAKPKGHASCHDLKIVMDRMIRQPVVRDEIIVVDKRRESLVARDPATGDPYVFWFVNNQSHSSGTFESPFPALSTALAIANPGDVIYIFPGDRTATGLDAMGSIFQLLDNQQLWGAGVTQFIETQFGTIKVPSLASGLPLLTGMGDIVSYANNNKISGLHFSVNGSLSTNAALANISLNNNLTVINNQFDIPNSTLGVEGASGIGGVITISNNSFNSSGMPIGIAQSLGISVEPFSTPSSITITNNTFTANGNPQFVGINLIAGGPITISDNMFNGCFSSIEISTGAACKTTIQNNNIVSYIGSSLGIFVAISGGREAIANVISNTVNGPATGIFIPLTGGGSSNITVQNNIISNSSTRGLIIESFNNTLPNIAISSNTITSSTMPSEVLCINSSCCVRFQNNTVPNGVTFNHAGTGTFNLEPLLANIPNTFTPVGSINNVPQGFCGN